MATLPGIDANDPSKCLTIFRLYSLILSSLPVLPVMHALLPYACQFLTAHLHPNQLAVCACFVHSHISQGKCYPDNFHRSIGI